MESVDEITTRHVNIRIAAEIVGVSTRTIRREVSRGHLEVYRPAAGRKLLFSIEKLQQYVHQHTYLSQLNKRSKKNL